MQRRGGGVVLVGGNGEDGEGISRWCERRGGSIFWFGQAEFELLGVWAQLLIGWIIRVPCACGCQW